MRAIRQQTLGGPEVLELVDVPRPEPAPTEVLVRVAAAGVNPVDWKTRDARRLPRRAAVHGRLGRRRRRRGGRARRDALRAPATGSSACRASRARRRPTPSTSPRRRGSSRGLRRSSSDVEAAALPLAGLTAWQALVETADVGPGSRVLILARGGRRRAPRRADRQGARRVRDRDGARGQARVPGRARRGRGGRLHERARRGRASATSTSCSTSSATSRAAAALATLARRRALHRRPVGRRRSTRCARPPAIASASRASSSSRTGWGWRRSPTLVDDGRASRRTSSARSRSRRPRARTSSGETGRTQGKLVLTLP